MKFVVWIALLTLTLIAPVQAGTVEVTYLGNEGFSLQSGETRILIDALQGSGAPGYVTLPIETRLKLESAQDPFAGVQLVLATHGHEDHFDPLAVGRFLTANQTAIFASTEQAGLGMFMDVKNYEALKPRTKRLKPAKDERLTQELGGVSFEAFLLPHGGDTHLGFIINLGGLRILHLGDSAAQTTQFRRLGIPDERFDIAFVPYWYFHYMQWKMAFEDSISAKHVVVMHLPAEDAPKNLVGKADSQPELVAQIKKDYPDLVFFDKLLESRSFAAGATEPPE